MTQDANVSALYAQFKELHVRIVDYMDDVKRLTEEHERTIRYLDEQTAEVHRLDALLVTKDREIADLKVGLTKAADDFAVIQNLNSHGASAESYIGWLRANAREAESRVRALLGMKS